MWPTASRARGLGRGVRRLASVPANTVLRGVVFDMDGTLTVPNLDFRSMYARCGVSANLDLLAEIALMEPARASEARAVIDEMEAAAASSLQLTTGAAAAVKFLSGAGVRFAMVTRNSSATVKTFEDRCWQDLPPFSLTISRDGISNGFQEYLAPKPDPAALLLISRRWGCDVSEVLMVGDSLSNDVAFGTAAGAHTVLVDSGRRHFEESSGKALTAPTFVVESLEELPDLARSNFVLPSTIEPV
ncbi:HAD-like domain-containing protein [Pelagophyceae sp. CCMP2097]|nr:HAD-like domain-containing protein [Pelagophyceae sp. CCMP2097]